MSAAPTGMEPPFEFSGGRLCLDFVNTVSGDRAGQPRERMGAYADLVRWARQAEIVDDAGARRLLAEARRRPGSAEATHDDALALREALYRIFTAIASGREAPAGDLARVSDHLGRALAHRRLVRGGPTCCALEWTDPPDALDAPLWRVAASAAELLTSGPDLARVRQCGLHDTHECSWLFMDSTRARTRRWCSMRECGNKAKARRHYERARQGT
ncbi:MAG TPA: ABATE domain-containing protein [Anaeromyxobacter sp.]|nr:ABATE domain-containing protein [Anaeromyxobacter sp.]